VTHPENRPVRKIVIVGGGSAGWMTAAALSSLLAPRAVQIVLVESDEIGTVGVGEATIPDIINFNHLLGIPETEFLTAVKGTFKLGIEFVDWSAIGETYFHPFGVHGADMQGIDFHQYWLRSREKDKNSRLEHYSLCAAAAKANKFYLPENDPRSVLSRIRYAYHFDATAYARYLRQYAEQRGVLRIEGKIVSVDLSPSTGFIESLLLDREERVAGDLFIDCSGFRALLLEGRLGVPFRDWSHFLPCDTAQAVACEKSGPLLPYTRSTATRSGWRWRIPTRHRTGNGQIYCSGFMSDEEAIESLTTNLDGAQIGTPRRIKFQTGHRERFWEKNCIAIGLSGGFLEPLESTSLFLIQEGISKLIALFPTARMPDVVRRQYNALLTKKFEQVRDFIILHYKATKRDDSPFWNYCRTMEIPDSLSERIALFEEAGRVFRYEDELFSRTSWVAVMVGQNIMPRSSDPIANTVEFEAVEKSLSSMRLAIANAAEKMPLHEHFLQKYAPAG
jgi:tryptophan halogenase